MCGESWGCGVVRSQRDCALLVVDLAGFDVIGASRTGRVPKPNE